MGRTVLKAIPKPPILRLQNATFFREHPSSNNSETNPALFPGTSIEIWPRETHNNVYWAVVGPDGSGKTTFLEGLKGNLFIDPPRARSHPYLAQVGSMGRRFDRRLMRNRDASNAIRYAGFGGKGSKMTGVETRGSYMAARYESRQELGDFSLRDYLLGNTEANPFTQSTSVEQRADATRLANVARGLQLQHLLDQPALVLSNGQTRRARIGKAFMEFPLLLLLDEPFLGIDPIQYRILAPALWGVSRRNGTNLVLALGNDKPLPRWITHMICLDNCKIAFSGPKENVYREALAAGYPLCVTGIKRSLWSGRSNEGEEIDDEAAVENTEDMEEPEDVEEPKNIDDTTKRRRRPRKMFDRWNLQQDLVQSLEIGEPIIEMKGVQVNYGQLIALGNWLQFDQQEPGLYWTIRRGERWGVFGPNGSGKTTVLSLVNSDHPKSYSQSISYFGRSRLPEPGQPGISIFDLQSMIMQSSPEVHAFFPKHLSVRATLENAWADTFLAKPRLTYQIDSVVDATLRWFERELNPQCIESDPLRILSPWSQFPRRTAEERISLYHERRLDWADSIKLSEISFGAQRVALFLRAIIKKPDLIILDEAFSGMDEETRIKCMMFLAYGETKWLGPIGRPVRALRGLDKPVEELTKLHKYETPLVETGGIKVGPLESRQALIAVAHEVNEVPPLVDKFLFLEDPGSKKPPRIGEIPSLEQIMIPSVGRQTWWNKLWQPAIVTVNRSRFNRSYRHLEK